MPLYHFDVVDGLPPMITEGVTLTTVKQARRHALLFAGRVLADQPPEFWDADEWVLTVSDAHRLTLFTVTVMTSDAPTMGNFA